MTTINLPEGWKEVSIGDYIQQINISNRDNKKLSVLSISNTLGFVESNKYFSKEVFSDDISNYKIVHQGDIAYNPTRVNIGSIACMEKFDIGIISPLYIVFRTNEYLDANYLIYFLKSDIGKVLINHFTVGAAREILRFDDLCQIKIPIPDVSIQREIVFILKKVEDVLLKQKEVSQYIDTYLKAVFVKLFGNPIKNPMNWEMYELNSIGTIITGNTPPRENKGYYGNYIEWIKSNNINTPDYYLTKAKEFLSDKGAAIGRIAPSGSILITCIAGNRDSIGNVAIADRMVAFNQQINAIIPNNDINTYFLFMQFLILKQVIRGYATHGLKCIVNKNTFEKIMFIKPPKRLQDKFGNIFLKVGEAKANQKQSVEKLELFQKSLIQRAFLGRLDINSTQLEPIIKSTNIEAVSISKPPEVNYDVYFNIDESINSPTKPYDENYIKMLMNSKFTNRYFSFKNINDLLKDELIEYKYAWLKDFVFKMLYCQCEREKIYCECDEKKPFLKQSYFGTCLDGYQCRELYQKICFSIVGE